MRIELSIIDEPDAGLCTIADLTGNGKMSKLLISAYCHNTYISEDLYHRLKHEKLQPLPEIKADNAAYYLNDLSDAKVGVIKELRLPGHTLSDVPVIVTPSFPAYHCDMVLSLSIMRLGWFTIDPDSGFVTISDE